MPLPTAPAPMVGAAARPGPGGRRGGAPAAAADRPRPCGASVGHPEPDLVAAAVDLDVDVALDRELGLVAARPAGRRGGRGHLGEVEAVLDPPGRVLDGDEVGVLEDGDVGRDGGGHPLDLGLSQGPQHAAAGLLAVGAPHDQLGHQVVVELADRVAFVVAGVGAHAVAVGPPEAGDLAGRRQEAALGRILGVEPDLDGVAVVLDLAPG